MTMLTVLLLICLLLLLGGSALSSLITALQRLGRFQVAGELSTIFPPFFLRYFLHFFFAKNEWEGLLFSLNFTRHLLKVSFVLVAFFYITQHAFFAHVCARATADHIIWDQFLIGIVTLAILASSLTSDFLASLLGHAYPWAALRATASLTAWIQLLVTPLTAPFFFLSHVFFKKQKRLLPLLPSFKMRNRVATILHESELSGYLNNDEINSILSLVSFKERIVREVMVPRIGLFVLSSDTSLDEAAQFFLKEGYSRIPVYKETIDNIVGVLHYKDIFKVFAEKRGVQGTIAPFIKPVLYTPETKKLSHLLQEFRTKQIHLAIVVDEWGGTEGIVTIEDILEELVGEIADEHDSGYQELYTPIPGGGWIVDAKMTIIDIEEELGIQIPRGPEYDTIGGYIFHRAGAIPLKGWKIHHDDFEIEVLSSNERMIEKIKIVGP